MTDAPNFDLDDDLSAAQVSTLYRHYLNVDHAPSSDAEHEAHA